MGRPLYYRIALLKLREALQTQGTDKMPQRVLVVRPEPGGAQVDAV